MVSPRPEIWMVDDDPADHALFRAALEEHAVAFESFHSAEAALLALDTGDRPSRILLDLRMPGLGGYHLLARRMGSAFENVPVIVMSSSPDARDFNLAYAKHANAYLQKPDDYPELIAFVDVLTKFWLELALLPAAARAQ